AVSTSPADSTRTIWNRGCGAATAQLFILWLYSGFSFYVVPVLLIAAFGTWGLTWWVISTSHRRLCLAFAAFTITLAMRHFDWPALPDLEPAPEFVNLDGKVIPVARSYSIGFEEYLWRIDAPVETLEAVAKKMGMSATDGLPNRFFLMPPY